MQSGITAIISYSESPGWGLRFSRRIGHLLSVASAVCSQVSSVDVCTGMFVLSRNAVQSGATVAILMPVGLSLKLPPAHRGVLSGGKQYLFPADLWDVVRCCLVRPNRNNQDRKVLAQPQLYVAWHGDGGLRDHLFAFIELNYWLRDGFAFPLISVTNGGGWRSENNFVA